jgi:hypothetical protein
MIAMSAQTIDKIGKFTVTDDLIPLPGLNKVAVPWPQGSDTILSQQGDGTFQLRPKDQAGTNETATVDGNTITFNIPEGVFVYALVRGL